MGENWAKQYESNWLTLLRHQNRPMKHKWGSCSSAGRLTFNMELLRQPSDLRHRVIFEELLHLKVPNHSALFRALLRAYLGGSGVSLYADIK